MVWTNATKNIATFTNSVKNSLRTIGSFTGDELSAISDDSIVYGRAFGDYTFDDVIGNLFNTSTKHSATFTNQTKH